MKLVQSEVTDTVGVKIAIEEDGREVARVRLYVLKNDVHAEPFGFLEYVIVDDAYQSKGYGTMLVEEVIKAAKERGCYKLICTSRFGKEQTHKWYEKFGFKQHGIEFRIDF
jgi:GNAT superfamily N-acetyltransferase